MGLWSFAAVRIVLNLFFALKDTRTPVLVAVISVAVNFFCGVTLMGPMGPNGLALSLSLASVVHLAILVGILRRKVGAFGWRGMGISIGRSGFCALVMGFSIWMLSHWLYPLKGHGGAVLLFGVIGYIAIGSIIFGIMAFVLHAPELAEVMAVIFKRTSAK